METNFYAVIRTRKTKRGEQTLSELKQLYRVLYQALIYADIQRNITFDRNADPKFKPGPNNSTNHFVNITGEIKDATITVCFDHLKREFYRENPNYSPNECYPLFFFGIEGDGMAGVALVGKKIGIMFTRRVDSTCSGQVKLATVL